MQWILYVYLIAAITTIMAAIEDPRGKRDLSLLTKLLSRKEHQHHKTKVYHVQSVDNYIVRAVPKIPPTVETVETVETVTHKISQDHVIEQPVAVLSSGLTDTQNENYFAAQGEQNMVETGVFRPPKPVDKIVETASIASSQFAFGAGEEKHEHISTLHQHPAHLYTHVHVKPVQEICDEPLKVITHHHTHLPIIEYPTKYSYKQIHNDGTTSYTSDDSKNVIVTDTRVPPPLPHYLNHRFKEILALNFHPDVSSPHIHVEHPSLHVNRHIVHGSHQYVNEGHNPRYATYYQPSIHVSHPSSLHVGHLLSHGTRELHHQAHQSVPGVHQMVNGIHEAVHVPQHYDRHQTVDIYQPSVHVVEPHFQSHRSIYPSIVDQTPVHVTPPSVYIPSMHSQQQHLLHVSHPLLHVNEPSLHIVEMPEVSINNMSENVSPVTSSYSYKHLHNDGKVTSYFGSGTVEEHQKERSMNSEIAFDAGLHNTLGTISSTPSSAFSYKNIHQDGSVTDYLQSGNDHEDEKGRLVVHNIEIPHNYPSQAGGIENVSGTVDINPVPKVASNYFESGNIYSGKGSAVGSNNNQKQPQVTEILNVGTPNAHSDLDSKIPSTFIYNTQHADGTISSFSDSGLLTQNPNGHFHGPYYCEDSSHVEDIKTHLNFLKSLGNSGNFYSYKAVHNDGSVTKFSDLGENDVLTSPETKSPNRIVQSHTDRQRNTFHPVKSQYSFKHVNHKTPGEHSTRVVSDQPEFQGHAEIQIASENGVQRGASLINSAHGNNKELYSSTYGPSSTVELDRISEITDNNGGSGTFENNFTFSTTHEANDESLSSNPIVVLPDIPTFSFTQNRLDGSSVTIMGDKENTVVVTEGYAAENRGRGDIPDAAV